MTDEEFIIKLVEKFPILWSQHVIECIELHKYRGLTMLENQFNNTNSPALKYVIARQISKKLSTDKDKL